MKGLIREFLETSRQRGERDAARRQVDLERREVEVEHRRRMELRHGWRPSAGGLTPVPVVSCGHGRGGNWGIAVAGLAMAVAVAVVGLAVVLTLGEPREWVSAYLELQGYLEMEDLVAQACFETLVSGENQVLRSGVGLR